MESCLGKECLGKDVLVQGDGVTGFYIGCEWVLRTWAGRLLIEGGGLIEPPGLTPHPTPKGAPLMGPPKSYRD